MYMVNDHVVKKFGFGFIWYWLLFFDVKFLCTQKVHLWDYKNNMNQQSTIIPYAILIFNCAFILNKIVNVVDMGGVLRNVCIKRKRRWIKVSS